MPCLSHSSPERSWTLFSSERQVGFISGANTGSWMGAAEEALLRKAAFENECMFRGTECEAGEFHCHKKGSRLGGQDACYGGPEDQRTRGPQAWPQFPSQALFVYPLERCEPVCFCRPRGKRDGYRTSLKS